MEKNGLMPAYIISISSDDVKTTQVEKIVTKVDENGNEVKLTEEEAKTRIDEALIYFVHLEDYLGAEEDGKFDKYGLNDFFTDNGVDIYLEKAKDYITVKTEKDDYGYEEENYYLNEQEKYQLGEPELYDGQPEIEITETSGNTIKAKAKLHFFKDEETKELYNSNNASVSDDEYFDTYEIELELIRTDVTTEWVEQGEDEEVIEYQEVWSINNYTITK